MTITNIQVPLAEERLNIFELLPGKILDVEINHPLTVRIKLPLIGYELGQYIILKYPDTHRPTEYQDVLIAGNVVIVRYLLEGERGECFAFRSSIRQVTQFPGRFLVLNYPEKIENRQLRLHPRITTHLPATIRMADDLHGETNVHLDGIITDISSKGCGFIFKAGNNQIRVKERDVFVCMPHTKLGDVKIPALVRNSRNELGKVSVGIQFHENDQQVHSLLEHLFIASDIF